jgi:hypothetical protein
VRIWGLSGDFFGILIWNLIDVSFGVSSIFPPNDASMK